MVPTVGTGMAWKPADVPGWGFGDAWSNEFTSASGRELTDEQFDRYRDWSERTHSGVIVSPPPELRAAPEWEGDPNEFIWVRLDEDHRLGDQSLVAYPRETVERAANFTFIEKEDR